MSEKSIMDAIMVSVSKLSDTMVWRNNSGLLYTKRGTPVRASVPGAPDLIGIRKGRFIGIEVKTEKGRQEASQIRFQSVCEKAGGLYVIARSPEEAVRILLDAVP